MRSNAFLIVGAALMLAAPATAQNEVAAANDVAATNVATDPAAGTVDNAKTKGLTAGPGALSACAMSRRSDPASRWPSIPAWANPRPPGTMMTTASRGASLVCSDCWA